MKGDGRGGDAQGFSDLAGGAAFGAKLNQVPEDGQARFLG
ncbi:hypothetical protein GWL_28590 [Herbaspirillum sp. GW103]|nr:hypothetical protein GWL_28590 [Herbaspirillum sp. GW103]